MSDLSARRAGAMPAFLSAAAAILLMLGGCKSAPDQRTAILQERLDSLTLQLEQLQKANADQRTALLTAQSTIKALREETGLAPLQRKPVPIPPPAATTRTPESPARTTAANSFLRTFGILCFTAFLVVQFGKIWRKRRSLNSSPEGDVPPTGGGTRVFGADTDLSSPVTEPQTAPAEPTGFPPGPEEPAPASADDAPETHGSGTKVRVYQAPEEAVPEADPSRWTIFHPGSAGAPPAETVVLTGEPTASSPSGPETEAATPEVPNAAPSEPEALVIGGAPEAEPTDSEAASGDAGSESGLTAAPPSDDAAPNVPPGEAAAPAPGSPTSKKNKKRHR